MLAMCTTSLILLGESIHNELSVPLTRYTLVFYNRYIFQFDSCFFSSVLELRLPAYCIPISYPEMLFTLRSLVLCVICFLNKYGHQDSVTRGCQRLPGEQVSFYTNRPTSVFKFDLRSLVRKDLSPET